MRNGDRCSWCARAIERDDGWRLHELPGARGAAFCRLEHVVPWAMQGPHWEPEEKPGGTVDSVEECARCAEPLGEVRLVLVRHRGEHRIPDGFCSVDHLVEWAKAGGRWS